MAHPSGRGEGSAVPLRLAAFYAAFFLFLGIHQPYWPVWLNAQGLSAAQIGILLAAPLIVKIAANPLAGSIADARGDRKAPLLAMSGAGLAAYGLFFPAEGFWLLLPLTLLVSALILPMMPLADTLTMAKSRELALDYGRIRLWGSLSYIAAATFGGMVLAQADGDRVLWMLLGALGLVVLSCLTLPDLSPEPPHKPRPGEDGKGSFLRLALHPVFLLFLAATALIQTSHMIYYGFATLHWRDAGLSPAMIGLFWSQGVIAEVLLFALSGLLVRRVGIARLVVLAGLAGAIRWAVLGATTAPAGILAVNWLHCATFGMTHLAAMHFIQRAAPRTMTARAQSLYASFTAGLAPGLAMLGAGPVYDAFGGSAFHVTALLALLGALAGLLLWRRWDGRELA
ncbi:3-phenylpropionate MFS transporter [Telmatospirillum sp. J64-1]|uniref:3-phenylpropionate MFS transporter n=1 Tax=Telmatospirillum sp. J64-1 TaxID=2502183 RepID=UPI00163D8294|nr:3-phenylpropionate MFS transporter [Telmatospirillum sp. J64-1]